MKQVVLLRGLPGSGKSTWAAEFVREHADWKRINKDSLRDMLDGGAWSRGNEKFVLAARDLLIVEALVQGYHVIVDDTNLDPKHEKRIREISKGIATVQINDAFLEVSLDECIARDLKRPNSVGEQVIRRMYNQYLAPKIEPPVFDSNLPDAIIVDLDGTLALHTGRDPYDCERCEEDAPNEAVVTLIRYWMASAEGWRILLVSGRDGRCRPQTERWLNANISYDHLWMRAEGDMRDDRIVKREIYEREIKGLFNVRLVLDDRNKVVDLWRSLGLTCWQVNEGNF